MAQYSFPRDGETPATSDDDGRPLRHSTAVLTASVEVLRKHGVALGTQQATVAGVGGTRTCAVTAHPVEVTLCAGTAQAVSTRERVYAVEGVSHLFGFIIGYNVLYKLGAMLDPLRSVL